MTDWPFQIRVKTRHIRNVVGQVAERINTTMQHGKSLPTNAAELENIVENLELAPFCTAEWVDEHYGE